MQMGMRVLLEDTPGQAGALRHGRNAPTKEFGNAADAAVWRTGDAIQATNGNSGFDSLVRVL